MSPPPKSESPPVQTIRATTARRCRYADGMEADSVRSSYNTVAGAYADAFFDELTRKPFDRQLLDEFAAQCGSVGFVLDIGCGPGHVARYLHESGLRSGGLDLSPEM